ncbi:GNAT family N-acetyltransferase [Azospirillum picis]|uniref:Ribosomal protein S18 acetylase RimI-like enzyme n=1 Tax=Azospirillum picis TaxID=488438 RepID=A0ABU0MCU3_9PROT|nr:GNAT family N-acetyltransferase [Azospirillum picis]MBP2297727.1 ribosomal protein S18 acetylase RimI-like enzyme [Azospirillum picis]MDQ0531250.1 ribosomal protein S18 acetylase RimI-like enzyme [Azospirillum picis]
MEREAGHRRIGQGTEGYHVRVMSRAELDTVMEWALAEGWNPGLHDAGAFHAADPAGFLVGLLDGRPAASLSVVRYSAGFGFLGLYIARPELRGRGFGWRLWQEGLRHLEGCTVGLDGVPAQQENYRRSGFAFAHRNIRFGGHLPDPAGAEASAGGDIALVDARTVPFDRLTALDAAVFPAPRPAFLANWIALPGATALAAVGDGMLRGFGVIRPCHSGFKIGPLHAADRRIARELVLALGRSAGEGPVFLDVPEPNHAAVALAGELALSPQFETARMYLGPAPDIDLRRVFGITSFELG